MLLTSVVSTLLGLTVLAIISFPFFYRKRYESVDSRAKSKIQVLRQLCDAAQSEINTLELEFGLGYLDQDNYERKAIQYRINRDELFSQLHLLECQYFGEETQA